LGGDGGDGGDIKSDLFEMFGVGFVGAFEPNRLNLSLNRQYYR